MFQRPLSSVSQLNQGQAAPWETDNPLSPISQLLQGKAKVTCAVGGINIKEENLNNKENYFVHLRHFQRSSQKPHGQ